jgi:hypothetical protein
MASSTIRVSAVVLLSLLASAGCNRSNTAEVTQAKADAEAARAEAAKEKARADAAEGELAKLKVAQAQPKAVDADRRAAEWAIRADAQAIEMLADGVKVVTAKGGKLPDGPITVISINLDGCKGVTDDGTDRLKGLKNIRALQLQSTAIKKLDFLDEMLDLESLNLSHTPIDDTSLAHVKGLKKLRGLLIHSFWDGGAHITDTGLENLKGLTELRTLFIFGTKTTDVGLKHLSGLSNLEYLAIGSFGTIGSVAENKSEITDNGLANLAGLRKLGQLQIIATQITDAGLEHIKKLSNLKVLQLEKTRITEAGVASLKTALPNCKVELKK